MNPTQPTGSDADKKLETRPICWSAPTTWVIVSFPVIAVIALAACIFGYLPTTPADWWVALISWGALGFLVSTYYHRLISHNTFEVRYKRLTLFILSFITASAGQGGPLWWGATHRDHHRWTDRVGDPHASTLGWWWCHVGWLLAGGVTPVTPIKDYGKYWEQRLVDRFHYVPFLLRALACYWFLGLAGLLIGFIFSTAVLDHCTFLINSAAHLLARKWRWLMAIVSWGEWRHEEHHDNPNRVRQGNHLFDWDPGLWIVWLLQYIPPFIPKNLKSR